MRGASVKEAAAGPGDVGEGENLSMNPTIYPARGAENRGEKLPHFHFSSHQQLPGCLPQHRFMIAAVIGWLGVCQVKLKHSQLMCAGGIRNSMRAVLHTICII